MMSQVPPRGRRAVIQVVVALGLAFPGAVFASDAVAQSEEASRALSVEEIRSCLCLERGIADLRREAELQKSLRSEHQAELGRIDRQIEQRRGTMNVSDEGAIRDLQELVARQQMLRDLLRSDISEAYQDSVDRLNAQVAAYNEQCAQRPMFKPDIDRAKDSLRCPAP